jgi:low affinity Fe/Cu permease
MRPPSWPGRLLARECHAVPLPPAPLRVLQSGPLRIMREADRSRRARYGCTASSFTTVRLRSTARRAAIRSRARWQPRRQPRRLRPRPGRGAKTRRRQCGAQLLRWHQDWPEPGSGLELVDSEALTTRSSPAIIASKPSQRTGASGCSSAAASAAPSSVFAQPFRAEICRSSKASGSSSASWSERQSDRQHRAERCAYRWSHWRSRADLFDRAAEAASNFSSSPTFFTVCGLLVAAWAASYLLAASDTVHHVLADAMAGLTLLLVALLKNAERRAEHAIQGKLDRLAEAVLAERREHPMTAQRSSSRPWACTTRFDASAWANQDRGQRAPAQGRSIKRWERRSEGARLLFARTAHAPGRSR